MGEIRAYSKRKRWSPDEEAILRQHYAATPRAVLAAMFPEREIRTVECKAHELGLTRIKRPKRTHAEYLAAKRQGMARSRAAHPERVRESQRQWCQQNRERVRAKNHDYLSKRFFWAKSMKLRGDDAPGHVALARLWKAQRGLCALTGRKLTRSAEVDHILPKARGGRDNIENLQWVCREANRAKRDLTDAEFASLCGDVMRWIGRRIQLVHAINAHREAAE